ncbi:MAG: hypothetical protein FWH03_02560 [Firmicutes bacterium]|nr:hypothetical protein [Bacillota bacterium]
MKRFNDENNLDDDIDGDEFEGFSLIDESGAEIYSPPKKKKEKTESYDDGEIVEASAIPQDEQVVILDNASAEDLSAGVPLTMQIELPDTIELFADGKKAGELKPAFVQKLLSSRKGFWVQAFVHSVQPPVMVKLKFYQRSRKGAIKI